VTIYNLVISVSLVTIYSSWDWTHLGDYLHFLAIHSPIF